MTYHDVFTILGTIDAAINDGRRSICVAVPGEPDQRVLEVALRTRYCPPESSQKFSWNFGLDKRMHVTIHGATACGRAFSYILLVHNSPLVPVTWVDQALRTRLDIGGRMEFLKV